jgi:hypothetical protein
MVSREASVGNAFFARAVVFIAVGIQILHVSSFLFDRGSIFVPLIGSNDVSLDAFSLSSYTFISKPAGPLLQSMLTSAGLSLEGVHERPETRKVAWPDAGMSPTEAIGQDAARCAPHALTRWFVTNLRCAQRQSAGGRKNAKYKDLTPLFPA